VHAKRDWELVKLGELTFLMKFQSRLEDLWDCELFKKNSGWRIFRTASSSKMSCWRKCRTASSSKNSRLKDL
jgi:hypothetical protein